MYVVIFLVFFFARFRIFIFSIICCPFLCFPDLFFLDEDHRVFLTTYLGWRYSQFFDLFILLFFVFHFVFGRHTHIFSFEKMNSSFEFSTCFQFLIYQTLIKIFLFSYFPFPFEAVGPFHKNKAPPEG